MKSPIRFLLAALAVVCSSAHGGALDKLSGTWDTVPIYRGTCESDTFHHTIEVSKDRERVTFKHIKPIPGPNGPIQEYTYKVLYEEEDRVTMYLIGETRTTPNGDRPIWVLILERPDYYRWRIYGSPSDARNNVTGGRCKE
jgi:hypothetical protein